VKVGDPLPLFEHAPVFGRPVDVAAIVQRRPLALVFLPNVTRDLTRRSTIQLNGVWDTLDSADVGLVAVIQGDLAAARDFVPRHLIRFPVLRDDGTLAARFGVGQDRWGGARRALRPSLVRTALYAMGPGQRASLGLAQRSAAFVAARGGVLTWVWRGRHAAHALDTSALERAALSA
jgi:peroxiredoxin